MHIEREEGKERGEDLGVTVAMVGDLLGQSRQSVRV